MTARICCISQAKGMDARFDALLQKLNTTFKHLHKQDEGTAGARRMVDLLALALQVCIFFSQCVLAGFLSHMVRVETPHTRYVLVCLFVCVCVDVCGCGCV